MHGHHPPSGITPALLVCLCAALWPAQAAPPATAASSAAAPPSAAAPEQQPEGVTFNEAISTYSVHRVPKRSLDAVLKSIETWRHQVLADGSTAEYSAEDGILSMECSSCGLTRPSAIDLATVDLDTLVAYEAGPWHVGIRSKDGSQDFFGFLRGEIGPEPHDPQHVNDDRRTALTALTDLYDLAYLTQNPSAAATPAGKPPSASAASGKPPSASAAAAKTPSTSPAAGKPSFTSAPAGKTSSPLAPTAGSKNASLSAAAPATSETLSAAATPSSKNPPPAPQAAAESVSTAAPTADNTSPASAAPPQAATRPDTATSGPASKPTATSLATLAAAGDIDAIQARRPKSNPRDIAHALETAYGARARAQMLDGKVDAALQTLSAGRQSFGKSPTLRDREAHYVVIGDAYDRLRLAVKLDVAELRGYLQQIRTLEPDDSTAIEEMLARTLSNRIADQRAAGRATIVDALLESGRDLFPAWADQLSQGKPGELPQAGVEIGAPSSG